MTTITLLSVLMVMPPQPAPCEYPSRTITFTYEFTVRNIPAEAGEVRAWVPLAPSDPHQRVEEWKVLGAWPHEVVVDADFGNRFLRFDLSQRASKEKEVSVAVEWALTRSAYRVKPDRSAEPPTLDESERKRYLSPNHLVPIDGIVAAEANRVTGNVTVPAAQARLLYDHIVSSVEYDKSGEGWGRGDATYACGVRKGNCTDFHSLYVGEARSLGIPARFLIGFPLPEEIGEGTIGGYHCWAEFFIDGEGWFPLDASEAQKNLSKIEDLYGGLDENRVHFTTGRDIRLPGAKSGPVNFAIYPHVEVDGRMHSEVEQRFRYRDHVSER